MKSRLLGLAVAFTLGTACTGRKFDLSPEEAVTKPGIVKITGKKLTDKGKKFNIDTEITNLRERSSIVFHLHAMSCYKGEHRGVVEHAFVGIGERSINILPKQMKAFNFLCNFGKQVVPDKGDYRLVITNVYDNPNNDGLTTGKILAKEVVWKIKHRK